MLKTNRRTNWNAVVARAVQLKDKFVHKGHQCIVFERLDSTLYDVLKRTAFKGVSLKLVRKITRQILVVRTDRSLVQRLVSALVDSR